MFVALCLGVLSERLQTINHVTADRCWNEVDKFSTDQFHAATLKIAAICVVNESQRCVRQIAAYEVRLGLHDVSISLLAFAQVRGQFASLASLEQQGGYEQELDSENCEHGKDGGPMFLPNARWLVKKPRTCGQIGRA